jgi:p-cumate 2,3-dioxygenase alpha subunit
VAIDDRRCLGDHRPTDLVLSFVRLFLGLETLKGGDYGEEPMTTSTDTRLRTPAPGLVVDDPEHNVFRVHRRAMVSSEVFDLEQRRIFNVSWLYVGHDSEIPDPGDYRRRTVAGRPLIFVRDHADSIRVLLNSCAHRGALVCRRDEGNDRRFQCFYHGWTYDLAGRLVNVPRSEAYPDSFQWAEHGLVSPPQVDHYRGLWFVNFDANAVPLAEYLADVSDQIDLTLDSAQPLGGWEVVPGRADYDVKANWKLLVENSIDMYHFATVHLTYANYVAKRRSRQSGQPSRGVPDTASSYAFGGAHGHGGFVHPSSTRPIANEGAEWSDEANAEVALLRERLVSEFGETRGLEMATRSRHLLIYPNLMFQDSSTGFRLRLIWPAAPDLMSVTQWEFRPRNELAEIRRHRLDSSRAFLGPGGFGTPDDVEALESCQLGYRATGDQWNDVSRGMGRDQLSADDEEQMRNFWRRWRDQIGAPEHSAAVAVGAR